MDIQYRAVTRLLDSRSLPGGRVVDERHRCTNIAVEDWRLAGRSMRRNAGMSRSSGHKAARNRSSA
jgi:hypothetical protein